MNFPSRDLTDQYISQSYQDVLQQYISASSLYVLDGLGNVVFLFPSSSAGKSLSSYSQYVNVSGSYTVLSTDFIIYCSSSLNTIVYLPDPTQVDGQWYRIKKTDETTSSVTISSSANIDYDTSFILTNRGSSVTLHSDSTQYWIH